MLDKNRTLWGFVQYYSNTSLKPYNSHSKSYTISFILRLNKNFRIFPIEMFWKASKYIFAM